MISPVVKLTIPQDRLILTFDNTGSARVSGSELLESYIAHYRFPERQEQENME
jgi:hypothetical protein